MEITIKFYDQDTDPKHVERFMKLLERIVIVLEDEPEDTDDG